MEIDCKSVAARLQAGDEFVLLDCRERDEYEHVRIEGARFLPMSEIAARASELLDLRDREIVVYCHHGGRSLQVARWLAGQGFRAVSMAGGIDRWAIEIDPSLPRY